MPLPQRWNQKKKKRNPPCGFEYVEATLEALEHELRDVVQSTDPTKRKTQAMWPIHQINWQKSRYIYDMHYIHHKISREVYQYCLDQKFVDAALIAKWKKPGYERLCSTYVIQPSNYKFGTTSICRVPWKDRSEEQKGVQDPTTGCLGCSSVDPARNIFGNKYGQYLAAIQLAREERQAQKQKPQQQQQQKEEDDEEDDEEDETETKHDKQHHTEIQEEDEEEQQQQQQLSRKGDNDDDDDGEAPTDDDDAETDDDDDEDFGPSPAAGIWAGSKKLERQGEKLTMVGDDDDDNNNKGEDETGDEDEEEQPQPPPDKKFKS